MSKLDPYKRVVADKGYVGKALQFVKCLNSKTLRKDHKRMTWQVSAWHETINARFKYWGILHEKYRHNINDHGDVVSALSVIIQLTIEHGEPLYNVE
jgi:hypothetical protein